MNADPAFARPAWVSSELFPFESRFVEVERHRVHYVDEGRGPTLLMFHGNPTWSFLYRHLITRLRAHFRCVAFDYPGFGLSTPAPGYDFLPASHARVSRAFVEALGLREFSPVVQDWGGAIGLSVSSQLAERVSSVIVCNTMAWPVDDDPHFVRFSRMMGGPIGGFAIRRFNAFVNVMIPMGTPRRSLSRAEMQMYRRPLDTAQKREPSHIFPREIVGSTAFLREVEQGLAALAAKPALLCWGDRDIAFREKERQRFETLFADATTVHLAGAGHYVQEDAPDEIADAIRGFFRARFGGAA